MGTTRTEVRLAPVAAAVAACIGCLPLQGCGGVTVSPAGPTTASTSTRAGHPTLLNFRGTLIDGGTFKGYIVYGSRDTDGRTDIGRFQGVYWDVVVTGGRTTRDAHFTHMNRGRAVVETYTQPSPAIGIVFLWPDADPALQWFTPHFQSAAGYKPDFPPALGDFSQMLPGSQAAAISIYRDGQGAGTLLSTAEVTAITEWPGERPPSD